MNKLPFNLFRKNGKIKTGILPDRDISKLVDDGLLLASLPLADGQIQPASIDLRLGQKVYRVQSSFLPGKDHKVTDRLKQLKLHEIDITDGAVLETGAVYIAELLESTKLDNSLIAMANPKSSTGRLDVFTRLITDNSTSFDSVTVGYDGPLYLEIAPITFPVIVRQGSRLSQLRFYRDDFAGITDYKPNTISRKYQYRDNTGLATADDLMLSVDLSGADANGLIGYLAKQHTGIIDVDKVGCYDPADFWYPLYADSHKRLILVPDSFYILVSYEKIVIPPGLAGEMVPIDTSVGEFRVHYAGFFDPGFGYSPSQENAINQDTVNGVEARAVLEVRSRDVPFVIEHRQNVGRLIYEAMAEPPAKLYGSGSNYQGQSLKLAKQFLSA